jgi:hypothetical protein
VTLSFACIPGFPTHSLCRGLRAPVGKIGASGGGCMSADKQNSLLHI